MKDGRALFHQPLFIYMYAFGPRGATAKFFKKNYGYSVPNIFQMQKLNQMEIGTNTPL